MNKFFALAAIAAVTVFSSCSNDDDDDTAVTKVLPNSFSARLLGAQTNAAGSFFSPTSGLVYSTGDSANYIANKVDVSFAQTGSPTVAKFISLASRRAEGLSRVTSINRITLFSASALTKANFDTIGNVAVKALAVGVGTVVPVATGRLYNFQNAEGKKGVIYVSNLDNGAGTNGSVTIDVKFEK